MRQMLQFNADKRISVDDALKHGWLKHLDKGSLDQCEPLSFAFEDKKRLPKHDGPKLRQAMWNLIRDIHPDLPTKREMSTKSILKRKAK